MTPRNDGLANPPPKPMRAYVIDPHEESIEQIEWDGCTLSLVKIISGSIWNFPRFNREGDGVLVDDLGIHHNPSPTTVFYVNGYPAPLYGRGLVVGMDRRMHDHAAPTIDLAWLRANVRFQPA